MLVIKKSFQWALFSIFIVSMLAHATTSFDINTMEINEEYEPGIGLPLASITTVQGDAVIVHLDETIGYKALEGLSIYRGDTIITKSSSIVNIRLNDQSDISVGFESTFQLNRAVFHPKKKKRSTFINMSSGRARFSVRKLKSFPERRFRVKTATALIGVRGSDFVIVAKESMTEVAAFENTELELTGLEMPDLPPVILRAFEKSSIVIGGTPMIPAPLSIEEINSLKNELVIEKKAQTLADKNISSESASSSKTKDKKQTIRIDKKSTKEASTKSLVLDSESIKPPTQNFYEYAKQFEDNSKDANTYITEQKHEIATELPEFPEYPE